MDGLVGLEALESESVEPARESMVLLREGKLRLVQLVLAVSGRSKDGDPERSAVPGRSGEEEPS